MIAPHHPSCEPIMYNPRTANTRRFEQPPETIAD
jgi:hypothetical protein